MVVVVVVVVMVVVVVVVMVMVVVVVVVMMVVVVVVMLVVMVVMMVVMVIASRPGPKQINRRRVVKYVQQWSKSIFCKEKKVLKNKSLRHKSIMNHTVRLINVLCTVYCLKYIHNIYIIYIFILYTCI